MEQHIKRVLETILNNVKNMAKKRRLYCKKHASLETDTHTRFIVVYIITWAS